MRTKEKGNIKQHQRFVSVMRVEKEKKENICLSIQGMSWNSHYFLVKLMKKTTYCY